MAEFEEKDKKIQQIIRQYRKNDLKSDSAKIRHIKKLSNNYNQENKKDLVTMRNVKQNNNYNGRSMSTF